MNASRIYPVLAAMLFAFTSCSEAPNVATDDPSTRSTVESSPKKGGNQETPIEANYKPSGLGIANELVDPDGHGQRRGYTVWATFFNYAWNGSGWEEATQNAYVPGCPGYVHSLSSANKGGKVVSVQLHLRDDSGGSWDSDKTDVDPVPPSEAGWTLEVHKTLDLYEGKGGNRQSVCSVYVNEIEFVPAQ